MSPTYPDLEPFRRCRLDLARESCDVLLDRNEAISFGQGKADTEGLNTVLECAAVTLNRGTELQHSDEILRPDDL